MCPFKTPFISLNLSIDTSPDHCPYLTIYCMSKKRYLLISWSWLWDNKCNHWRELNKSYQNIYITTYPVYQTDPVCYFTSISIYTYQTISCKKSVPWYKATKATHTVLIHEPSDMWFCHRCFTLFAHVYTSHTKQDNVINTHHWIPSAVTHTTWTNTQLARS